MGLTQLAPFAGKIRTDCFGGRNFSVEISAAPPTLGRSRQAPVHQAWRRLRKRGVAPPAPRESGAPRCSIHAGLALRFLEAEISQNKTRIKKAATHVIPTPTVLIPNAPRFRIDADFQPLWILALGYRDLQTPLRLDDRAARLSGTAAKGVPSWSNTNRNGRSSG